VSQADLDRLARVHEFNDAALSKDLAVAAFQRYVQAVLNPETAEDWKKFATHESQNSTLQIQRNSLLQYFGGLMPGITSPDFWPYISDVVNTATAMTAEGSEGFGFRIKVSASNSSPSAVIAYVIKQGNDYVVAGLANSNTTSLQAVRCTRGDNVRGARQWLDWERQAANRPNLSEVEFQKTIDLATSQSLLAEGKAQEAAGVLLRLHQKDGSDRGTTFLLSEALIQSNRSSDAKQYIELLEPADPVLALRLRAHVLAQQRDYSGAAAVEKQICERPNAAPADWNDLGWSLLFTGQNAADALKAAEKAAQLTSSSVAPVLHTLAIAQANAGHLKEAIATGYQFQDLSGDRGELQTIFGRIAEELQLVDTAREYYSTVPKENGAAFSNYSFAQTRLSRLTSNSNVPARPQK
jgi:tetratricopeptide (TPR) repeat protein